MENKCVNCIHNIVCDHNRFGFENCGQFKPVKGNKEARKIYVQQYCEDKYKTRKANHQCVACGCELKADATKTKCDTCSAIGRYSQKKYHQSIKAKGICRMCGVKLPEGTRWLACDACREIEREKAREKRGARK